MTDVVGNTTAANVTTALGPPPVGTIGPARIDTDNGAVARTARIVDAAALPPALSVAVIETV
jgi:hypothetical protein